MHKDYTPFINDNSTTARSGIPPLLQWEIPTQLFDHSIPIIRTVQYVQVENQPIPPHFVVQLDGGANRSITNNPNLLQNFRHIRRYAMTGISDGEPALYCTGKGYLMWRAATGETLAVSCYYSSQASETIISPTDVVLNHIGTYKAWSQHADIDDGTGHITFHHRNGHDHAVYNLFMRNGLWFYSTGPTQTPIVTPGPPTIRRLTAVLNYFLLHFRLAHAGKHKLAEIHLHFRDMPKLTSRNVPLLNCTSCTETDVQCRSFDTTPVATAQQRAPEAVNDHARPPPSNSLLLLLPDADQLPDYIKQKLAKISATEYRFQMDFGFPRGSTFKGIDNTTCQTFTSINGYRAYLLIILYPQRRVWIFLTKNKKPPIDIIRTFLRQYDQPGTTHRVIRSDQGGELWKSAAFRKVCCDEFHYILEPTAAGTPQQNGLAERPNRTFGKMMRCLLHSAGLGPQFWSYALLHAVWVYNRLPHSATGVSPYTAFSGKLPSAKHLRIFGCRVIVRQPGERQAKLDSNATTGIFLGYTATDKNIIYRDEVTQEIKTATHVVFDEAHLTAPRKKTPPAAAVLQHLGFSEADQDQPLATPHGPEQPQPTNIITDQGTAKIVLLDNHATTPTGGSDQAVEFDLYSAVDMVIDPGSRTKVNTAFAITPPIGYFGQILS